MKPQFKRIIAREFLFLLAAAILCLISTFIIYYVEEINREAVTDTEDKIEIVTSYDELPYRLKVFYYLERELGNYVFVIDLGKRDEVIKKLTNQEITADVYEFISGWGEMNISRKKFYENIEQDRLSKKSEVYLEEEILPLEEELRKLKYSTWNWRNDDKMDFVLFMLGGVLFFLRYLIYATTWSIRQVRKPVSN